jgi:tRNA nucleotidyltransferase/poly(A) polymerase
LIIQPEILNRINKYFQPLEKYYLVGGTVRDSLLQKGSKDIDIVCSGDTRVIARNLADEFSGAFYVLDEERNTCRVIVYEKGVKHLVFDFAHLRGDSIDEDLRERDFTINAMAVDLVHPDKVLDPLMGARDLLEKRLQPCSSSSFLDDPVRVIRAVRYAVNLNLNIQSSIIRQLKEAVSLLGKISPERKRDELFKILENDKSSTSFQILNTFGILSSLGIELDDCKSALHRMKIFETLSSLLANNPNSEKSQYFLSASILLKLGKFRTNLKNHLYQVNLSDRNTLSLDKLGAFLWDLPCLKFERCLFSLALSNQEIEHLTLIQKNRSKFQDFAQISFTINDRIIFNYFKSMGATGLDLALLSLADFARVPAAELNYDLWLHQLELCEKLFQTWYERPEVIYPPLILRGTDLFMEFDLSPGPLIGKLLDGLREEQAAGVVKTRREALEWVEVQLFPKPK